MKILVTGTEGYIGSLLAPRLLQSGHEVVGLDAGYYRDGWLYSDNRTSTATAAVINKDVRDVEKSDLEGVDAIAHLAELSNDPLGANKPEITFDINHKGSVRLAEMARSMGIRRFVYTSSCSVYGKSDADYVDENSAVDPQTAYAECKVLVERDVAEMASQSFCPVFLRNATAYGASPRMRFDIVLNNLAGLAWTTGKIAMTSDGSPWRPLVHVLDICAAVQCALEAPDEPVHNQVFNVGALEANFTIREIAEIVGQHFPESEVTFGPPGGDNRSYRVKFDKIHDRMPAYATEWTPDKGAEQLRRVFSRISMSPSTFEFRAFTRLKQLEYLIRTAQLDERFYWSSSFSD